MSRVDAHTVVNIAIAMTTFDTPFRTIHLVVLEPSFNLVTISPIRKYRTNRNTIFKIYLPSSMVFALFTIE